MVDSWTEICFNSSCLTAFYLFICMYIDSIYVYIYISDMFVSVAVTYLCGNRSLQGCVGSICRAGVDKGATKRQGQ